MTGADLFLFVAPLAVMGLALASFGVFWVITKQSRRALSGGPRKKHLREVLMEAIARVVLPRHRPD
jgi:hypothetical protein